MKRKSAANKTKSIAGRIRCEGAVFLLAIGVSLGSAIPVAAHVSSDVSVGLDALSRGELERSEAALQRARLQEPDDSRIGYDLGIVKFRKREYAEAIRIWERTLPNASQDMKPDILHNIGNAQYRLGDWARAVGAYQTSLEAREDPLTRYNLEQAQARLKEEQEAKKQEQKGQGKDQDQNGKNSQGEKGDSQQKDGQQKDGQGKDGQQKDGQQQASKNGQDGKDQQGHQGNASDSAADKSQSASSTADPNASGTRDLSKNASQTPEMASDEESRRQEMAMGKDDHKESPPPPDVSERAKSMKKEKVNPYLLEKMLKDMEQREREIQLRYRRDPQNGQPEREEMNDPFGMDAEQLRDFLEQRGRPRAAPKSGEQDAPNW
ncbi:MAG: tetratricopeptide repeat protein [Candidatus Riflebacteria bacterium]|nr:tetratricopeptide repeat protein [Candidatus Riflebacteria bacterium]